MTSFLSLEEEQATAKATSGPSTALLTMML
jgi:hypothetical protein